MQAVVDTLLDNWRHGEKTLIFCFRINTAERLQAIAEKRIKAELLHRRSQCLGGKKQLVALRKRVTGRNSDLVPIVTDRVLWSRLWFAAERGDASVAPEDFTLTRGDVDALAELSLRCRVPLTSDKVDRVWLTRATEHVIARRLLERDTVSPEWRHLLRCLAQESWILHPYGLADEDKNGREGENVGLDQRGMNALYKIAGSTSQEDVSSLARRLMDIRLNAKRAGQTPVLDAYASGPNLWTGESPGKALSNKRAKEKATLSSIHRHLWSLRRVEDGGFDWQLRRRIFEALRRAFLREPVLLRLLPSKAALAESSWGKMLVQAFLDPLPNQSESMADHIAVFLEDLIAASDETRDSMLEATKLRNQQIVALVKGKGGGKANIQRDRVFTGFNTPLLPEVLVCTSIGQEGIDLHRHCRHVIHYDLAWNPAVLEQRTGRVDRIGSKTFRERDLATTEPKPRLEIGVPFLAGTYDERMFEELRLRAQTFEVLTGGELVADNPEGSGEVGEGSESNLHFIPLPESMVSDMRVNLHVWNPSPASRPGPPKRIGARVHALLPVRDPGVVRGGPHE